MTEAERLLAPLRPDSRALAPLFQANIDDAMLREIAEADYGWKADECYVLLQEIRATGLAESDEFMLREVLQLTSFGPRSAGSCGAWIWLFSCTALLQLAVRHPECFWDERNTLAPFLCRAIDLGEATARAAASVLAWRFLKHPGDNDDPPFFALGILVLAAHLERGDDRGPLLNQLAAWVEQEEARVRSECDELETERRERVGLMPSAFGGLWRDLARRILIEPASPHPLEADAALRRAGQLILKSSS